MADAPNGTTDELQTLVDEWATAERRADTATLARILADDFVAVGPRGFLLTKEEWLQRLDSGDLTYQALDWSDATIRAYGDTAIVIGRQDSTATYRGQIAGGTFRGTLVFVRQDGRWRLAGLQLSPLATPQR